MVVKFSKMVSDNMRGRIMGFYGMTWSIMPIGRMYIGGVEEILGGGNEDVPMAVEIG